ncbi:MAG: hypothetical protein ACR2JR_09575 [Rubrobacteraceae bacterium]
MKVRAAAWLGSFAGVLACVFSIFALVFVELNGDEIGTADATGSVVLAVSFSAAGAVIAVRRPGNPIGWILLVGGFFNSLNAFSWEYARYALLTDAGQWPVGPFFAWLSTWAFAIGFSAQPLTLLLFPTGRPPSRRWRPVLWIVAAAAALMVVPVALAAWPLRGPALVNEDLWSGKVVGLATTLQQAGVALAMLGTLLSVVAVAVRFRGAAGEERQQIKWLVYAGALTFIVIVTASPGAPYELPGLLGEMLSVLAFFALPSIPVAVGIAIMRYRLYDIDVIINRTLVYGGLTISLALVYVGCIVSLQYVFRALTGNNSQLVVVASTLAIAALFNPFRRRVQAFVDRRFYRGKYDAARTLEAFNARLRDDTDLEDLSGDLTAVVGRTLQPEHVSLWLREPGRETDGR